VSDLSDLDDRDLAVLRLLRDHGPLSGQGVALGLGRVSGNPSSAARAGSARGGRLVGLGLAERSPDGDGQRHRYRISPLGLEALGGDGQRPSGRPA
jgi:hypothetical protein